MTKLIIYGLIILILILFLVLGMRITLKPFNITFNNLGEGLCLLGLIICFSIACQLNFEKGKKEGQQGKDYRRGLNDGAEVVLKVLKLKAEEESSKSEEEFSGGRDYKVKSNDKGETKHL